MGPWARASSALVAVLALVGLLVAPAAAGTGFTDVPSSNVFHRDVTALATAGITRGCNPPLNTRFCPDAAVTRGQMAAFLDRALDLPAGRGTFGDTRGHRFADSIAAFARAGITRGCNPPLNTRFCPDATVTRGQMAAFLDRALDLPAARGTFGDTRGHRFADSIAALAAAGITRGCNPPDNTRFCPDAPVTRAQMAAFLVRAGLTAPRPPTTSVPPPTTSVPPPTTDDVTPTDDGTSSSDDTTPTDDTTPPPPDAAFDGPLVGAHVHALWGHYDDDTRARVLDELAAAGVRSIRVDIGWASVEEACSGCISSWYVKRLDTTVAQAEARGMDVLGVLWRTPSWAGDLGLLAPPRSADEYGRVAGWLADRYAGRITAWELWNEPNLGDYFHGTLDEYLELVRAASPAIRAADPSATIVLGGTAHNDSVWLDQALGRGIAPYVDVVAVHPYPTPSDDPPTLEDPNGDIGRFAHLTTVLEVVERHAPGTRVWLTEFGWSSHATAAGAPLWHRGVTREQQAQYAVDALVLLRDRWPQVERAYWFRALDRSTGSLHMDNFGLLEADGSPKPVAHGLRELLVPTP